MQRSCELAEHGGKEEGREAEKLKIRLSGVKRTKERKNQMEGKEEKNSRAGK